jgi:RND superfamily putative drug exporter
MTGKRNIAARAGRWSAAHRKTAILGWLAFVILAFAIGGAAGTKHLDQYNQGTGESGRADRALGQKFHRPAGERVLVQARGGQAGDAKIRAGARELSARLADNRDVTGLRKPVLSRDGHSLLVEFQVKGSLDQASKRVASTLATTSAAQRAHPNLRIEQAGDASAQRAAEESMADDFGRSSKLSVPITLAILVVAFGALAAAGIPVFLAITGVLGTLGMIAGVSQISPVSDAIGHVVLLVGMAVGVDYALFYLRREREERARGATREAALQAAAATSGRSVLISGLTVMVAMAGMYLTGDPTFSSFATGTILVVAVAMVGSLTVLPALLSKLGDGVMKGRVPFLARRRETGRQSRVWGAVLDRVLRRPRLAAVVAGGALVALSVPAFSLHTAALGADGLPQHLPIVKTVDRMERSFPGGPMPAQVVVQARDVTSPETTAAIRRLESEALATGQVHRPVSVEVNRRRTVAVVSLPLSGHITDDAANRALDTLRDEVIPASGLRADVTGPTAQSRDFNDMMKSRAPLVFLVVLAMAFVLLLVTFRSIVIPIKAIALNLLSVGASYGVLVLVFQHGVGESLLGFEATGAVTSWLPLFLFVILFGLSMDYHVFILSRVREAFDRGASTEDAVRHGIKSTAGVVTSAAAVMVAVFAIFASLGALEFKQMGVGLATAVLIDATIVRGVLLPATMKLLGDWNWYLPRSLGWLPRVAHEPARA